MLGAILSTLHTGIVLILTTNEVSETDLLLSFYR